jgi:hypothetical protein
MLMCVILHLQLERLSAMNLQMNLQLIPWVYPGDMIPAAVVRVPHAQAAWMLILGLLAVSCAIPWFESAARWAQTGSAWRGRTTTRRPFQVVTDVT